MSVSKEREEQLLAGRTIPQVKSLELISDDFYKLENGCRILLCGGSDPEELEKAEDILRQEALRFWNCVPVFERSAAPAERNEKTVAEEAYVLELTSERLRIEASGVSGFRNALRTCRQLSESSRGVEKTTHFILPCVKVEDSPALHFRGVHLCWFPETPVWEIEKQLRLAAYYKFNYVVLESWGVLELESHPEFCWSEYRVPRGEIRRLLSLAKDLGVTLVPQVNIFGHATASRSGTGKHVLLDFHPEFAPFFEPDGWTWCLSNPATRTFLRDIVLEIHELFGSPEYFHIGCDEAYNAGSCAFCRRGDYAEIFKEHLVYFRNLFAERGTRIMMWHDMLLLREDERWNGYIVCGHRENGLESLYRELPKDIVICDWQYGCPKGEDGSEPLWPTSRFFKENGFDVLVCPFLDSEGTRSLGRFASTENLHGMLATTWHCNRSGHMFNIFYSASNASWNPFREEYPGLYPMEFFNRHVREVGLDMGISEYAETGSIRHQVNPLPYQGQGW